MTALAMDSVALAIWCETHTHLLRAPFDAIKMVSLPRQARDKHGNIGKALKRDAFFVRRRLILASPRLRSERRRILRRCLSTRGRQSRRRTTPRQRCGSQRSCGHVRARQGGERSGTLTMVRTEPPIFEPFICKPRSFYQDRLGTTIGNIEQRKGNIFCRSPRCRLPRQREDRCDTYGRGSDVQKRPEQRSDDLLLVAFQSILDPAGARQSQ